MTALSAVGQNALVMSGLALAMLCLRARLGGKTSPQGWYVAGLILAVGLLIPFRPVLPVSLLQMPAMEWGAEMEMQGQTVPLPQWEEDAPSWQGGESPRQTGQTPRYAEQSPFGRNPLRATYFLCALWIAGAVLAAGYHAIAHVRFRRLLRRWRAEPYLWERELLCEECERLRIRRAPRLVRCTCFKSPLLTGLFRPVLVLSPTVMSREETRLVIRHELTHFRRRDLWGKALMLATTTVHWFNPLVWRLARAVAADCEMACDEAVLWGADDCQRRLYGRTLLAAIFQKGAPKTALSTTFARGGKDMKKRFASILSAQPRRGASAAVALALLLTLFSGSVLAVAQEAGALSPTTGLPTDKPYRPVLAVVSNDKNARPIWNLSEADIVYEAIIWGPGHTRFLALYNDNHPEMVGGIRGARAYQAEIRAEWDSVFVSQGGQTVEGTSIRNLLPKQLYFDGTGNIGTTSKNLYRNQERISPHNAVADISKIVENEWPMAEKAGQPYEARLPNWKFSDKPSTSHDTAVRIDMTYDETETYQVSYTYNPETRVYERWNSGEEQFDGASGKRIAAANVIMQYCDLSFYENSLARPVIETVGSGTIYAFIDGKLIRGTWAKESLQDQTVFMDSQGNQLTLLPGKTFIQILPPGLGASYQDAKGMEHMFSGIANQM